MTAKSSNNFSYPGVNFSEKTLGDILKLSALVTQKAMGSLYRDSAGIHFGANLLTPVSGLIQLYDMAESLGCD